MYCAPDREAKCVFAYVPTPGPSFRIRVAMPSLLKSMVYLTVPTSYCFGLLAFSL
ncbi:hypothetical protein ACRRTK_005853 [Alexandromys fortis]